jgi:hypothetical protein
MYQICATFDRGLVGKVHLNIVMSTFLWPLSWNFDVCNIPVIDIAITRRKLVRNVMRSVHAIRSFDFSTQRFRGQLWFVKAFLGR